MFFSRRPWVQLTGAALLTAGYIKRGATHTFPRDGYTAAMNHIRLAHVVLGVLGACSLILWIDASQDTPHGLVYQTNHPTNRLDEYGVIGYSNDLVVGHGRVETWQAGQPASIKGGVNGFVFDHVIDRPFALARGYDVVNFIKFDNSKTAGRFSWEETASGFMTEQRLIIPAFLPLLLVLTATGKYVAYQYTRPADQPKGGFSVRLIR